MSELAARLLDAIRNETKKHLDEIEGLPEWKRPRADSPYQSERERAAGWLLYQPSAWLNFGPGSQRNRLPKALDELRAGGLVETLCAGQRTISVRMKPSENGVTE